MMNETTEPIVQETSLFADPVAALLVILLVGITYVVGLVAGALAVRPNIPRARIRLRALKHYLNSPQECNDELVQSLVRKEIRSLENRLKIDADQD